MDTDRRAFLRLLTLSAAAVAGGTALASCAADPQDPGLQGGGAPAGDLELVAADAERPPGDPAAVPAAVAALHRSGGAILGRLGAQPGNLAISPYSIAVALAMTANGAAGETRTQLELGIGGLPVAGANPGLNALAQHTASLAGEHEDARGDRRELVLAAANQLFGQRGVAWEQPFLTALAEHYGAGMRVVDYADDPEGGRSAVNTWTAEQTRDRIEEILPAGSVDPSTRLVLVNTLYLKAPWHVPFEKGATADGDFTRPDGSTVAVPMMRPLAPMALDVAEGPGWQAVRLPYAGRGLAMTVVVPDAGSYDEVEDDVVAGNLAAYLTVPERDAPLMVDLTLPRWTFRTSAPLKEVLMDLGVEAPFADADLTPMTEDDLDLYVDEVHHQVYVAVDEEGTEAAAATAVVVAETSAPLVDLTLVVDRPFLFVVHDVEHGAPLFLGRVSDPVAG